MNTPAIVAINLHVQFGAHDVLDDLCFSVPAGGFLAVVGPNGSGKTTLIKTVLGLVEPNRGTCRVFGKEPAAADPARIGYVPQIKTLDRRFPALTTELVATGLHRKWPASISPREEERVLQALDRVGASTLADRPLGDLSGGELQRVYLARTLVREPVLILLDEPATGIDTGGASDLYKMLERYQSEREATIVMVTHDLNAAFHHATRVLLLDRRQLSFGKPREALSDDLLRQAFGHIGHQHFMQPRNPAS